MFCHIILGANYASLHHIRQLSVSNMRMPTSIKTKGMVELALTSKQGRAGGPIHSSGEVRRLWNQIVAPFLIANTCIFAAPVAEVTRFYLAQVLIKSCLHHLSTSRLTWPLSNVLVLGHTKNLMSQSRTLKSGITFVEYPTTIVVCVIMLILL